MRMRMRVTKVTQRKPRNENYDEDPSSTQIQSCLKRRLEVKGTDGVGTRVSPVYQHKLVEWLQILGCIFPTARSLRNLPLV